MPFSIVEKPAFRRMLQTFDSQYELPGRTYVSQTAIPQLYNSVKDDILKEMKDLPILLCHYRYVVKYKHDPLSELDHTLHNC